MALHNSDAKFTQEIFKTATLISNHENSYLRTIINVERAC